MGSDVNLAQQKAAWSIAKGEGYKGAAAASGLTIRQIFRLVKKPAFTDMVRKFRDRLWDRAAGVTSKSLQQSIKCLQSVIDNPDAAARDRIAAAKSLVAMAISLRQIGDLSDRIKTLEGELAGEADEPPVAP